MRHWAKWTGSGANERSVTSPFDEEPNPGGGYEDSFAFPIWAADGIERRVVVRRRGAFERVSIVLEEERDGVAGQLIRFDDAHGCFHRHRPGWPEPSEEIAEFFEGVPARQRVQLAINKMRARYTVWETEVFGQEGDEPG
jgi:hypothetical protein